MISKSGTGSNCFVLYKYISLNFNALMYQLLTIDVYVVKIYRLLYLLSLSNSWNYPHFNVYFFVIERKCGLGKKEYLI